MSRVTEQIYVGSQAAVRELGTNLNHITHILNCGKPVYYVPPHIKLLTLRMPDEADCDPKIIWQGIDFIRNAVNEHGVVLVHCRGGVSRSRSMVAAYLTIHHNLSFEDAIAEVKKKHPLKFDINPATKLTVSKALQSPRQPSLF